MLRDHTSFSVKWSLDHLMLGYLQQPRIVISGYRVGTLIGAYAQM